jgi:hypothetical protein
MTRQWHQRGGTHSHLTARKTKPALWRWRDMLERGYTADTPATNQGGDILWKNASTPPLAGTRGQVSGS